MEISEGENEKGSEYEFEIHKLDHTIFLILDSQLRLFLHIYFSCLYFGLRHSARLHNPIRSPYTQSNFKLNQCIYIHYSCYFKYNLVHVAFNNLFNICN